MLAPAIARPLALFHVTPIGDGSDSGRTHNAQHD